MVGTEIWPHRNAHLFLVWISFTGQQRFGQRHYSWTYRTLKFTTLRSHTTLFYSKRSVAEWLHRSFHILGYSPSAYSICFEHMILFLPRSECMAPRIKMEKYELLLSLLHLIIHLQKFAFHLWNFGLFWFSDLISQGTKECFHDCYSIEL